jgi:glucose/arabinose dehydrogenase
VRIPSKVVVLAAVAVVLCATPVSAVPAVHSVAIGLDVPWEIEFLPDGSALFTERDTLKLKKLASNGLVTTVQTVGAEVGDERGLLGLAVSPNYAADGTVFVYYTTDVDSRVARLVLGGKPEPIVTGIPVARNHNGGGLEFGPDGALYASVGDNQNAATAQDLSSLAGKVLRFTTTGEPAPGNPFPNSLVYSYGHRNPEGLEWVNDRLYATEFGESETDELNWIRPGGNYGWPACEGPCGTEGYLDPVVSWVNDTAGPSGIAFHHDALYIGAVTGRRVLRVPLHGTELGTPEEVLSGYGRMRAIAPAPDGTLWVGTSNQDSNGTPRPGGDRILRLRD